MHKKKAVTQRKVLSLYSAVIYSRQIRIKGLRNKKIFGVNRRTHGEERASEV